MISRRRQYLTITVLMLSTVFFSCMLRVFPGFIPDVLMDSYQLSAQSYALIEFCYFLPYSLALLFFSCFGPVLRLSRLWVLACIFLIIPFLMVYFTSSFGLYLLSNVMLGFVGAIGWLIFLSVVNSDAKAENKAFMMGVYMGVGAIGQLFSAFISMHMVNGSNWMGLYSTTLVLGLLTLLIILASRFEHFFSVIPRRRVSVVSLYKILKWPVIAPILVSGIVYSSLFAFIVDWSVLFERIGSPEEKDYVGYLPLISIFSCAVSSFLVGYLMRKFTKTKAMLIAYSIIQSLVLFTAIHIHPDSFSLQVLTFFAVGFFAATSPICSRHLQKIVPQEMLPSVNLLLVFSSSMLGAIVGYLIGANIGAMDFSSLQLIDFQRGLTPLAIIMLCAIFLAIFIPTGKSDEES